MKRLQDIADQVGVSRTTVSNVLHGNTKKVSKESGCERCEQTRVAYAAFCVKSLRKRLKVLFMVSKLCDTVFTGEVPGIKQTHRRETP